MLKGLSFDRNRTKICGTDPWFHISPSQNKIYSWDVEKASAGREEYR
jgi:hypothetical protein